VRFLDRKVYLAALVVLVGAMRHGPLARRVRELTELFGTDRRTTARWCTFWREHFPQTPFWKVARSRFVPWLAIAETARRLRPRLLLLDPLVRLHGVDENHAGEVAELLAYFRLLQRRLGLSVMLVHHTRKNTAGGVAAGQGLRGSSDLHAFGDSNLYLRRDREPLVLLSEHRAAPATPAVTLELVATDATRTHLEVVAEASGDRPGSLQEQVLACLVPGKELTRAKLRDLLSVQNRRLGEALETLEGAGAIRRSSAGWQRAGGV
jgi:hypothetical protein